MKETIEYLPEILQFYIPGFIFLSIIIGICQYKISISTKTVISCVCSFIFVSGIRVIGASNIWSVFFIACVVSLVLGITIALLAKSKRFNGLLIKIFGMTVYSDIWDNIYDYDNGTNLKIYLKGKDYYFIGHLKSQENNGKDSWVCISKPQQFEIGTDKKIYGQEENNRAMLVFNLQDVDYMEVFV